MYAVLNAKISWCHHVLLTLEALEELTFWLDNIDNFNGQNIWPEASAIRVVYSDASGTGYGGYCMEHGGTLPLESGREIRYTGTQLGENYKLCTWSSRTWVPS